MPNVKKKWSAVFEEENKLKRQRELITMRNLVEVIANLARHSHSFDEFADNLDKLYNKIEDEINK